MTQYERFQEIKGVIRKTKKTRRQLETASEKLEREFNRLLARKTMITVSEFQKAIDLTILCMQLTDRMADEGELIVRTLPEER